MSRRILFLADVNSAHTRKWAGLLAKKNFIIGIFSLAPVESKWYESVDNVLVFPITTKKEHDSDLSKIGYIRHSGKLRRIIKEFDPDIVHAHYATSYGLIGAMSGFHPFVLSVWGSDVFEFPLKSFLHKALLKFNLKAADVILSTSKIMAMEISKYTDHSVIVTPFGINLEEFKLKEVKSLFNDTDIVIGTIKSLEHIYGIDLLIQAFKKISETEYGLSLKLLIVGGGSKEDEYKKLVKDSGLAEKVVFTGKVEYVDVVDYHNMIDIFINVSRNESFGVSVLEASACETAVIATRVGGLVEVVTDNVTGILVESENIDQIVEAVQRLVRDEELRKLMGSNGRQLVKKEYDIFNNLNGVIGVYNKLMENKTSG